MRDGLIAYMGANDMAITELSRRSGVSVSSIRRILEDPKPKERPALQKLHVVISEISEKPNEGLTGAFERITRHASSHDALTVANILRAVADLLDQAAQSTPAKR